MAVSRSDCIRIGAELFEAGKPRPVGDSWQAKAQAEGWNDSYIMHHGRKSIPVGVAAHINSLCAMATKESNIARCQRLMNKANALEYKWQRRAFLHTVRQAA